MAEEKIEKGMISEDALDEIAGGINVDKGKLKKGLKFAGIAIVGAGALAGGKKLYDETQRKTRQEIIDNQLKQEETKQQSFSGGYDSISELL